MCICQSQPLNLTLLPLPPGNHEIVFYICNLFTKQKQTHRHRKQTYGYQGKGGEGLN